MKTPEGWKLVPVEPTPEMERNAWTDSDCRSEPLSCKRIYKAMLAAAPTCQHNHQEGYWNVEQKAYEKWICLDCGETVEGPITPTPPAQEAEPVAWTDKHGRVISHRVRATGDAIVIEQYSIPLYTHAPSDKLRQAAEKLLESIDDAEVCDKWFDDVENLRSALEGE